MVRLIRFDTKSPDADHYRSFIDNLRDAVVSGIEVHGFMLLRDPSRVPNSERFVFVELTNREGQSITLAIDITNLYVVGYRAENSSFFLNENNITQPPYNSLFTNTERNSLSFGGRYVGSGQLEQTATGRENIELGIEALDEAIRGLSLVGAGILPNYRARRLIVVIQMVSEAVRFRYIEQEVVNSITSFRNHHQPSYRQFRPNAHMLSLENSWDALSEQIQQASGGNFQRGVRLNPATSYAQNAYNVNEVTFSLYADVAVIKYYRESKNQASNTRSDRAQRVDQNQPSTTSRKSQGRKK